MRTDRGALAHRSLFFTRSRTIADRRAHLARVVVGCGLVVGAFAASPARAQDRSTDRSADRAGDALPDGEDPPAATTPDDEGEPTKRAPTTEEPQTAPPVDDAEPPPQDGDQAPRLELDPALLKEIERIVDERVEAELQTRLDATLEEKKSWGYFNMDLPQPKLEWRGDFFTKVLTRNNASGGCVSYGNPAPEGDNFAGDNGICSELGLTVVGHVSERVEAGARIQSRYGAQWANWWENGDLKGTIDGSGESLGMNHASYLQLRGIYLRIAPPIPSVRAIHFGASDLAMFNAWTIGKIRYTERDNARGIFVDGSFGPWLSYTFARVALPKLWASANYNTGIDDPLVENPFWERDAAWAAKFTSEWEWFKVEQITSYVLDEESDLDDPDAIGSTNTIDVRDGVVVTNPRYQNVNATLELSSDWLDWLIVKGLAGYSYSKTSEDHVFNGVSGAQGFTPVPMGEFIDGYAVVTRASFYDPWDLDLEVHGEYFNIGKHWVSVMGARREQDLLLTDGFLDGQVATLNIANEFQDFNEAFYEPIIGWHGATMLAKWSPWDLVLESEGTFITYNTNTGTFDDDVALDTDNVYPDFLYTDGMTDTEFYSYANTNDRGRDPRSVYHKNQNRRTLIGVAKGAYTLDLSFLEAMTWLPPITFTARHKTIWDVDLRNLRIDSADDYNGLLFFNRVGVELPVTEELSVGGGYAFDVWWEQRRSGDVIAGVANYPDYLTLRQKAFFDVRYVFGGASIWYHVEYLNKDVTTTDPRLDFQYRHIVRSLAMISAAF